MKNISIFCGAHRGKNPQYTEAAKTVAECIAKKGINFVFGGGNVGLMKVISDTALDYGVEVLGISLKSLHSLELANPRLKKIHIADTLLDRKEQFMSRSDAFIVLPGGVGSMDELLEVMVSNQLGGINKPVGLLNTNGYYNGFLDWLQRSVDDEFVSEENQRQIHVSENPKELLEMILSAKMPSSDTWIERLNVDFPRD